METASKREYVIGPDNTSFFNWKELWDYRELFYFFTWRDVKVKYKQTALGLIWVFLQPVFMVLIFTFSLRMVLNYESSLPYPVFVFSGLVLWNFFSAGVNNAGNSMVSQSNIIKKIYFPRLVIPLSAVISAGFDMLIALLIFIITLFFFQVPVNLSVVYYWPAAILITLIASVGAGCWLSALMVKYRDFRYVIPFLLQALLFLTPIIYPITPRTSIWVTYVMAMNPMFAAIWFFRTPMMFDTTPNTLLLVSVISGVLLFLIGTGYFKRTERYFADLA
ncbi:ABC transporter permease [Pseudochryseolinea flava]|uniref:Transport permease protein n=1 Tax=Pseudochryseolinea flava TaxID=2059302 RepID=A0A364Y9R8_9BACT|nr:ABC transporter permease [Pseudochryseolinea flava]RAW02658.1 ABC transporter permease [Pseudochryseolinea flava]